MDPLMLQLGTRLPMSTLLAPDAVQTLLFHPDEERWFAASEPKRPLRACPSAPPPPIGDAIADQWFR
jgi:hypothetical protein